MSGTLTAAVKAKATESPAEEGISGKKKKIRESKNRKKYWKKADVTEVDEFLENQRFNERIGGDVSFKEDDQLFMVDRSTDEAGEKRFQKKRSDILKVLISSKVLWYYYEIDFPPFISVNLHLYALSNTPVYAG